MSEINIRLATKADESTINTLFIQMIQFINEENKKNGISVDENLFKNGYDAGYLDRFFVDLNNFIIVADFNGQVIGYLSCEAYHGSDSYLYLDDFCVDSNCRSNGVGTKLIESADEFATINGFKNLKLHVDINNVKAQEFYANLGFMPVLLENNRIEMKKEIVKKDTMNLNVSVDCPKKSC